MVGVNLVGGPALLVGGAELLVRGASRVALRLGLSPLVIGLTVVAFGASAPELAVTLRAALSGTADLALGNVVGSNVFNVLVILGASAVVTPLVVSQQLVRLDVPILVGVSILTLVLALDGRLGASDGAILFAGGPGLTESAPEGGRAVESSVRRLRSSHGSETTRTPNRET